MNSTFNTLHYNEYHSVDFDTCMAIFESNVPHYFSESERRDVEEFLLDLPGPYLMCKEPQLGIVGCGGYAFNQRDESADLCWGMIHKNFHKQGFGQALLSERLERIKLNPDIKQIHLNTCQLTERFFESAGFKTRKITKDDFADGLHRHNMILILIL